MTPSEQYRADQVRPWLESVRGAAIRMRKARAMAEMLVQMAEGVGAVDYSRVRVDGGGHGTELADRMDGIARARMEADAAVATYRAEVDDAAARLSRLDPEHFMVLAAYYLEGAETLAKAGERVAKMQACSGLAPIRGRTIYKRHDAALVAAYDVIPTEWRDPRPSAV